MAYKSDYTGSEIDSRLGGDTYLLDEDDLVDNGGTVIEQSNFDSHIATSDAHHSRYADAEAQTAINDDPDHGDTAPHNYFSGSYADLTDVPATFMPEEHGNEAHSETYLTSVPVDSVNGKTGSVTLIKSDVDLGNVPNTDIAYSTTIAADAFTQTEVDNLRAARLDDGSTPWASNNYYSDADVDNHLSGGDGISYSAGTITIDSTVLRNADLAANDGSVPEIDRQNIFTVSQVINGFLQLNNDMQATGNIDADGFTINGTPVGTSTDTYWNVDDDGNIYYRSGSVLGNPISLNKNAITSNTTIPAGYNACSVGPLVIDANITINGVWKIL